MLQAGEFATFFMEVHGHEPFPWQERLLRQLAESGQWPSILDLPTGAGKTAALDIATFHLALEADRGEARRAPVRIAFVVDRRIVVDDAYARACKLERALESPAGETTARVADRLRTLSGAHQPLVARRLRGGVPREDDWARTPAQPTILCSTVDQVGSRLLFRGYGVSDSMKPVHAGLLGSDCLILLDEAHIAEPFRQTLESTRTYRGRHWRESDIGGPWGVALLTATPGSVVGDSFTLDQDDRSHPVLTMRLDAGKPVRLIAPFTSGPGIADPSTDHDEESDSDIKNVASRGAAIVAQVLEALRHFENANHGAPAPAIGVVVNRVARARVVFELLRKELAEQVTRQAFCEPILLIGPSRPLDRDRLAALLEPVRTRMWTTGERRALDAGMVIVATQCIEAGVDIDLDALISEAAPIDALRQRLGRLNRAGRDIRPYAAIVVAKSDISGRHDDPVYGKAIKPAWDYLMTKPDGKSGGVPVVDFGLKSFDSRMRASPFRPEALSPKFDAPVLLPAHLDLLSQTSPVPAADPDLALYLHGPGRQPDSITVVWRGDVHPARVGDEAARRLLTLVPPRSSEAIELPLWAVLRWLQEGGGTPERLADVAVAAPNEETRRRGRRMAGSVYRWKGDDDRSRWIPSYQIRTGDTIVVPAEYGGLDGFGWNSAFTDGVTDLGREAARPYSGRRFALRVAPGLLGDSVTDDALADALAAHGLESWRDLRAALLDLPLPEPVRSDLKALDRARQRRVEAGRTERDDVKRRVVVYSDLYGTDDQDRPRGVVFLAPFGLKNEQQEGDGQPNSTEDDVAGSLPGFDLSLDQHREDVMSFTASFAQAAGLPAEQITDLKLAAELHDAGKADPRFQAWLHYGDPFGPDPEEPDMLLAKSGRRLPRAARTASALPERWRHEALSVRVATSGDRLAAAADAELVIWLIGTHHGHGRPLFPHCDPTETAPDIGPQSLAFDWHGLDWTSLFSRLRARYGIWELARMEAIIRLADHRASELRAADARF